MFNLAEKRSVAIANGQNPNEANNIFWSSANVELKAICKRF